MKSSSGGFRSLANSAVSPYNGSLIWTRHGAHHIKPLSMYTQILKAIDDPAAPGPAAILQHGLLIMRHRWSDSRRVVGKVMYVM